MPPFRFLERLNTGSPLVLDGATGTNLQARGLPVGTPSDIWVLDNPAEVLRLHRDFLAAGSDIILTNTFGPAALHLAHAGLEARFEETNRARGGAGAPGRRGERRAGGRLARPAGRDGRAGGHAEREQPPRPNTPPRRACWPRPGWTCW